MWGRAGSGDDAVTGGSTGGTNERTVAMGSASGTAFVTPAGLRGRSYRRPGAEASGRPVVAIGQFDGVHLGHRLLLDEARRRATAIGAPAGAVTFDRHPLQVLAPGAAPVELTSLDERIALLLDAGLDLVVVLEVGHALLATEPREFVDDVLSGTLDVAAVVVGTNFRFGRGATGDPSTLRALGPGRGFDVVCPELALHGEDAISSTRIRAAIGAGRLDGAAAMLGPSFATTMTATGRRGMR